MATAESGRVRVDGHALEYTRIAASRARAPTLVLLHEGLGSLAHWKDFPARVAAATGLGALVYSRAGYGGSDRVTLPRPLDYMQHEGEHVVGPLLDALAVQHALLVGHSDGASIALVYAGTAHGVAHTRGAVLIAPHVFCEDVSVTGIQRARDAFVHGDLRARLARYHGAQTDETFHGWCDAWLDPRFRAWNLERHVPAIRAPVLLVQGRDDEYGTLAQLDAIERALCVPHTRVVIEGAAHSPQRDHPDETLAAIVRFVNALDEPG